MIMKLFKTIRFLIILALLLACVVVYLAVTGGGDSFRWAGRKTEEAGKALKNKLEQTAERADQVEEMGKKAEEKLNEIKEKIP